MKITIVNRDQENAEVFDWRFRNEDRVQAFHGSFEDLERFDCIATAGNSFGLMDAGIDLAIVRYFGRDLMETIQRRIHSEYLGEQPVGTSLIVDTGRTDHRYVAHTPTMRIPMNVNGTDNVYVATWATLLAAHNHNVQHESKIEWLALPAFCTGTGGVDVVEASLQMQIAIDHFFKPPRHLNPTVAQQRHDRVHFGGRWGFENPRPADT